MKRTSDKVEPRVGLVVQRVFDGVKTVETVTEDRITFDDGSFCPRRWWAEGQLTVLSKRNRRRAA